LSLYHYNILGDYFYQDYLESHLFVLLCSFPYT